MDWVGTKIRWTDPDTGEVIHGYLFVAVLLFSGYGFVLGCHDMKQPSWINAHLQMFEYFQGVPTVLVPYNLKTGVTKHTRTTLKIDYGHKILPPLPFFLPLNDIVFTTPCQQAYQYIYNTYRVDIRHSVGIILF